MRERGKKGSRQDWRMDEPCGAGRQGFIRQTWRMVDELTDFVISCVFFAEGVRECEEDE